ncbi:MAG: hypothetical protein CM15mP103_06810 [Gammaproteobacteria bacterium]|nr:MAG: hypothetical protein CM15mP103_06810 [Gammaproteobacteria bacterium]
MNRLLTLHKLVALVAAISGAMLMGCSDSTGSAGSRYGGQVVAVPVTTVPAQLTDLRETLTSVGTARASKASRSMPRPRVASPRSQLTPTPQLPRTICSCNSMIAMKRWQWNWLP